MWARYSVASSAVTAAMVSYVWATREQFYPTVVYLVTSKVCVVTLGNQAIVMTLLVGRFAKAFFLGTLREAEVELLYENARYAVTETCLALTIFREELTIRVFALFSALLFAKVFHWLANSRVEYVERAERVTVLGHVRLVSLISWLFVMDVAALTACAMVCLQKGPSVLLLFGFEFAILSVVLLASSARYALHAVERRFYDGQWASKGSYVFFVEFCAEALRFMFYIVFFTIVFTYYGVPLHIVRELWVSFVSLRRRLSAYRRYRALTANMEVRFETPTAEELDERGRTCIICRDAMLDETPNKKLPCGHSFHLSCLRLWLQQQQSCPTCRAEILNNTAPAAVAGAVAAAADDRAAAAAAPPPPGGDNNAGPHNHHHHQHQHHHHHHHDQQQPPAETPADDDEDEAQQQQPPQPPQPQQPPANNDGHGRPTPEAVAAALRGVEQLNREVNRAVLGGVLGGARLTNVWPPGAAAAAGHPPARPPALPEGTRVWRIVGPQGARVLTERRPDSPSHRTIARGQHVLTLDDPATTDDATVVYLRLGDGWLISDAATLQPFEALPGAGGAGAPPAPAPAAPSTPLSAAPPSTPLSAAALAAERRAQSSPQPQTSQATTVVPTSTLDAIQSQLATISTELAALRRTVDVLSQDD